MFKNANIHFSFYKLNFLYNYDPKGQHKDYSHFLKQKEKKKRKTSLNCNAKNVVEIANLFTAFFIG